jgi:uncharacterized protein with ATP-grasp and redox domains
MKLAPDCYECLLRLIHQAASLATDDASLKQKAINEAMKVLDEEFSYDQLSLVIASKIHKIVREVTHNPDPYRAMKEREMTLARELYLQSTHQHGDDLRACLQLAAAANAIDFFRELRSAKEDIKNPVSFAVDDSEHLEAKLRNSSKVLYLADNAGELYFDLPLVKKIRQFARAIYVVKPSPVQNDLTLEDVRSAGLEGELGKVISTGVASPGVLFSLASAQFRRESESADLIFAKGMGHYEALSELPPQGKFFYCLKAKCRPIASSLGVPIDSYVAMLR